jgi:hypothetical protein
LILVVRKQFTCNYAFRTQEKIKCLFGGKAFDVNDMLDNNGAFSFGFIKIDRDIEATIRGIGRGYSRFVAEEPRGSSGSFAFGHV